MKKVFVALMLISSIIWSQEVKVLSKKELTGIQPNSFYFPVLNYDGTKVLLSKENYAGLFLFDIAANKLTVISEELGTGYNPIFSEDGSKIIYKKDYFDGIKKYSDLIEYNLYTGEKNTLLNKERFMSFRIDPNSKTLFVNTENKVNSINLVDLKLTENKSEYKFAIPSNESILLVSNNNSIEYKPFGNGNYIWVSLSNNNKLLFQYAGKGTFVTDLNTNEIYEIGKANAPIFSVDGKYVIYMNDKDDGHKVFASDILVSTFDGKSTFNLTSSVDEIEVYPAISGNGKNIAYCTEDGRIVILEVSFE
ncbi:MAG TPA: hypothetical protein PL041_10505 [Melioribacteraceae bacterium]|nr:hypothetical protein [Melioribacteraceae bacterium]